MKRYSKSEIKTIKDLYSTHSASSIASRLGRSVGGVQMKANQLGLKKLDKKWPAEKLEWLKTNWEAKTNKELAQALGITLTLVRNKLYELGLKRMEMEYWTEPQVSFLKAHYQSIGDVEMAEIFQSVWPKKKGWTSKHIDKKRGYLNLKRSDADRQRIMLRNVERGRFATANLKRWEGTVSPEGTIKVWKNKDGKPFKVIRTADGFVHYNRWLWQQEYGDIPEGKCIAYRDGDSLNCVIENLKCVDRGYHYPDSGPVRTATTELTDGYVASLLAPRDKELRLLILNEAPELIELKRQQLRLNRAIKKSDK